MAKGVYQLRLRKNEDPRIQEFLEIQTGGQGDVLRYLVEKEIAENGIRDLSNLIPVIRNIDNFVGINSKNSKDIKKVVNSIEIKENKKLEEKILNELKLENEAENPDINIETDIEIDNVNNEIALEQEEPSFSNEENLNKVDVNIPEEDEEDEEDDDDDIPSCYKN